MAKTNISKLCSIDGCSDHVIARGWCQKHHGRWRRHGDPLFSKNRHGDGKTREERFWNRVKRETNDRGCWIWQGGVNEKGYGRLHFDNKNWLAHRLAFFLTFGRIPEGVLRHDCDNPPCVNPSHTKEGTNDDNMQDMVAKGRAAHGDTHCNAKLNAGKVREVKSLIRGRTMSLSAIGRKYGVGHNTIRKIKTGKTWKHVKI